MIIYTPTQVHAPCGCDVAVVDEAEERMIWQPKSCSHGLRWGVRVIRERPKAFSLSWHLRPERAPA